jgi:hypothetical protein
MKAFVRTTAVTSLLTLTACLFGTRKTTSADPDAPDWRVQVNVTNNYALPVDVLAAASGAVYRLGTVAPGIVGHFILRRSVLASGGMVEFVAKPAGTEPPVQSGRMLLKEGDVVDFAIATNLVGSRAIVRP